MKDVEVSSGGRVVYWYVPHVEIPYSTLTDAWAEAGLDAKLLPKEPRPGKALRRAVSEFKAPRRLPRPLKRSSSWALVDESVVGEDDLSHHITATAKLEEDVATKQKTLVVSGNGLSEKIRESYDRQLGLVNSNDIVDLLLNVVTACEGISLRKAGGFYYIPPKNETLWATAAAVVESIAAGAVTYKLEVNLEPGTVQAFFDAMVAEATKEIDDVFEELEHGEQLGNAEKPLGVRAIKHRIEKAAALKTKVANYEALLGKSMGPVASALESLVASLVEAEVRAEALAEASSSSQARP